MLAARWPPRSDVGDPDPFAVVSFTSDHPAFALCENGCPVTGRRRGGGPLVAAAPLISGVLTAGVLGFVKCCGRKWKPEANRHT